MSNLNDQIEATRTLLNDIKTAIQNKGVDTSNLKPQDYPEAINNITGETTVNNLGFLPVLIFRYSETRPITPEGGSGDPVKNEILSPIDGYIDISDDFNSENRLLSLGMSSGVFANDGTIYKNGSTPVRISGKDGKDGKQGVPGLPGNIAGVTQYFNYPLFTISDTKPDIPNLRFIIKDNQLDGLSNSGWSLQLTNSDEDDIVWQCYARCDTSSDIVICTDPVRITAESTKIEGNIRYYQLSDVKKAPTKSNGGGTEGREDVNIAPTETKQFLYVYDKTVYKGNNTTETPVYLMATYVAGLEDIDLRYTCAPTEEEIKDVNGEPGFENSEDAIKKSEDGQYKGLNEETKYLGCKETYKFNNGKAPQSFYSIISYYKAAEKAPILYSAGTFNPKVIYTRTEDQCPYVFYPDGILLGENDERLDSGGKEYNYFFLKNSYEENSGIPFEDAYDKEYWRKIESFEAIYSDIGIFKAAEVGKFVFDQKYMFSQFGRDNVLINGEYTDKYYSDYDDYEGSKEITEIKSDGSEEKVRRTGIAVAIEDGEFVPSALINAVTGEAGFAKQNAHFNPNGDGKLGNDDQYIKNESGKITLQGITLSGNNVTGKDDVATKEDIPKDYVTSDQGNSLNVDDKISAYIENKKSNIADTLKDDILDNISKTDLTTKIGNEYIQTGTTIANTMLANEIYGKTIKNNAKGDIGAINSDGSGGLAGKNIKGEEDGSMEINGSLIVNGSITSDQLNYSGLLSGGQGDYNVNRIIVSSGSLPTTPLDNCIYIIV